MSVSERTERVLNRAARGEADIAEIEDCISATRADLDHNLSVIERQLSPDALIHKTVDYLRSTPGEFFANFGDTVKRNPLPTALLGVSLGWLMLSGRRQPVDRDIRRAYGGTEWAADVEVYEDREVYGLGVDTGVDAAREGEDVSPVDRVRDAMRSTASSLTDRASQVAGGAAEKLSEADQHAREVFQRARERVARARRIVAQQPKRVKAGAQDMAEHHPLMLGAIAFVAGAAIAASMKRSRIEDQMMGDYRDQALAEAETRVRTELDRGVTTARSALDEAGHRAAAEGGEQAMDDEGREPTLGLKRDSSDTVAREQPGQQQAQDRFH